jgi:hypothetical protein
VQALPQEPQAKEGGDEMKGLTWAVLCLLLIFGWFVWPSRYSYREMQRYGETVLVRVDRFSGQAEWLSVRMGWLPMAYTPLPESVQ